MIKNNFYLLCSLNFTTLFCLYLKHIKLKIGFGVKERTFIFIKMTIGNSEQTNGKKKKLKWYKTPKLIETKQKINTVTKIKITSNHTCYLCERRLVVVSSLIQRWTIHVFCKEVYHHDSPVFFLEIIERDINQSTWFENHKTKVWHIATEQTLKYQEMLTLFWTWMKADGECIPYRWYPIYWLSITWRVHALSSSVSKRQLLVAYSVAKGNSLLTTQLRWL